MEKQLFKYEAWDQTDTFAFAFYGIETVVDLPGIPKGTKFATACVDFESCDLKFYDDNDSSKHEFKLTLNVTAK